MWLDEGAHLLLYEPLGLGSAAVMHGIKLYNKCCTISFGYKLSTTAAKLGYSGTTLVAQQAYFQ